MKTFIFFPALPRMSGGLAVLWNLVNTLHALNIPVYAVLQTAKVPGQELSNAPKILAQDARPTNADIWLVPEGFVNALTLGLQAKSRCVVFVQNQAFLLSSLPDDVFWNQLPVSFLAVSRPVAWFIKHVTGQNAVILRPSINRERFTPSRQRAEAMSTPNTFSDDALSEAASQKNTQPKNARLKIAWMPRKNKAFGLQIKIITQSRAMATGNTLLQNAQWIEINNNTQQEVATILQNSHIFLATGFPEGFALPPLEAMACGCLPVGFAGFGGLDYLVSPAETTPSITQEIDLNCTNFVHAEQFYLPAFNQPSDQPNSFIVSDGDIAGASLALEKAAEIVCSTSETATQTALNMYNAGQTTADHFSQATFVHTCQKIWQAAAEQKVFMPV